MASFDTKLASTFFAAFSAALSGGVDASASPPR